MVLCMRGSGVNKQHGFGTFLKKANRIGMKGTGYMEGRFQ